MKILRRLLAFVLPESGHVLLAVLLGALTIGAGIGLLATSAYLISAAALSPALGSLQIAIVGVRFFGISRGVFRYLERLTSHDTTFRVLGRIRLWLYNALEPLSPAGLVSKHSGDLLARIVSDIETLENFYVRLLAPPLVAIVVTLGACLWMGTFAPLLSLALLGFLLLIGVGLSLLVMRLSRTPGQALVASRARLQAEVIESLQGLPDLVAYDGVDAALERIRIRQQDMQRTQKRMAWISSLSTTINTLLTHLGGLSLLSLSIPLVETGHLDGVYLAVIVLGGLAAFESVQNLPSTALLLESNLAAARRLFEIADTPPPLSAPAEFSPLPAGSSISVRGLTFAHPNAAPALQDISFDLPPGKRLAIVGPSGAGKSTLASLLLRFLDYQGGEIHLDGTDVRHLDPELVRNHFGVVTQSTYLFDDTLRGNLLLANPSASAADLADALDRARLTQFFSQLPQGLDTPIGEHGWALSGGERQRLAIARAYLRKAPVLLLDEPTSSLDPRSARQVMDACLTTLHGSSLIWITHQLAGLEAMDEIIVLNAGCIVQRGTHKDLMQEPGLYRDLWAIQKGILIKL